MVTTPGSQVLHRRLESPLNPHQQVGLVAICTCEALCMAADGDFATDSPLGTIRKEKGFHLRLGVV